jgi:hypothetical protein
MVGAERFEASFPSDHYALFFVRFDGQTSENQEVAQILRSVPFSLIFSPMDGIPQEFGITGITLFDRLIPTSSMRIDII